MKKSKQLEVNISQIDFNDRSYLVTFESSISQLILSIKQVGLIQPPILEQKSSNKYRIVAGLKRILALQHLKIDNFNAIIYFPQSETPDIELFLLSLYENLGTRSFNNVEKALVLDNLINLFKLSEEQVLNEFLPLLQLGKNKLVLDRYLKLVPLEDNIKIAVAEDFVSIDIAGALVEISSFERQAIFEFFQHLKLGKNRQKEFLRLLREISKINDRSIDNILKRDEIQDILSNVKITLPGKIEHIKIILKRLRYPLYSAVEKKFQILKKDLGLPTNVILRPPPFFEGEKYSIEINFKNQSELTGIVEILTSIIANNKLEKLQTLV